MPIAELPPAALRFRVHGDLSVGTFLKSGNQTLADIESALQQVGTRLDANRRILDFGCGCGRTLLWLASRGGAFDIHGVDVDRESVAWGRRHIPNVAFSTSGPLPPLPYQSETFDLVYAISVFTHLDEEYQLRWLDELRRIVTSNGHVLITVHGRYYWNHLSPHLREVLDNQGIVAVSNPAFMDGLFPEWYQTTYHAPEYISTRYSDFFEVVHYIPLGLESCQDVVVLQKR